MRRVLIFGATSAIAREIALRCARRGDRLYLVGRDAQKLAALVSELGDSVVGSVAADLNDTARAADHVSAARSALGGAIDVALVAQGLLGNQLETEQSFDKAAEVFATNLLSAVALLIPLGNVFEAQRSGTIAVITSVAGDRGRPRNYTYGSAKGALNIYLQGLRSRLFKTRVKVYAIRLGPVHTPMTADHPKNALFVGPDVAAEQILSAIEGRAHDVYLPWYWRPIMAVVRNLPERIFQRFPFLSGR